jgi:hypothetical protein
VCKSEQNTRFICVSSPLLLRGQQKYGDVPACCECEWIQEPPQEIPGETPESAAKPMEARQPTVKPYRSAFRRAE